MSEEIDRDLTLTDIGIILIKQARMFKRLLEIVEEDSLLEGTSVTNTFTLPAGIRVTTIDFVEGRHDNPANLIIDVPLKPVALLKISNLGPGIVYYSTNKGLAQKEAAEQVLPGEHEYIRLKKRAIKRLNIVTDQTSKIRVTSWI